MPDLKDLGFSVQEKVPVPDFDGLVRRGRQRRVRRQLMAMTGTAAAAALVAIIALSPVGLSRSSDRNSPASEILINPAEADLRAFVMTAPDQWVATWEDCVPAPCRHGVKIQRGDRKATATSDGDQSSVLRFLDPASSKSAAEPMAILSPQTAPTLFRLTPDGPVSRELRRSGPTSTFDPGEVLTDEIGPKLAVVSVREETVRELQLPAELAGGRAPIRDETGRWWVLAGQLHNQPEAWIAWTDDGGRTWSRHRLAVRAGARFAVSRDGRTVVTIVTTSTDPRKIEAIWTSHDRGATWTNVKSPPSIVQGDPVVFDDGTALLIGRDRNDHGQSGFRVNRNGTTTKIDVFPSYTSLGQAGELIYATMEDTVSVSTDRGLVWTEITP